MSNEAARALWPGVTAVLTTVTVAQAQATCGHCTDSPSTASARHAVRDQLPILDKLGL